MRNLPEQIQKLVSRGLLDFSEKAFRQLFAGIYDEEDIQNAILLGTVIKKERDETGVAKYKYTIIGPSLRGDQIYCCGKIRKKGNGRIYFIITFHGAKL